VSGIVVFGREPVAGGTKTRLAEAIGRQAAARVYALLLEHTLRCAGEASTNVVLSLAAHPSPGWNPPVPVTVDVQGEGDLGARMAQAFRRRFEDGWRRVVLVGSDCAELSSRHLHRAMQELKTARLVIGPASDGGYWLIGQRPPGLDLFSGVPWSSSRTLVRTCSRIAELDADCVELETLADVDTVDDLERLMTHSAGIDPALSRRLAEARDLPPTTGGGWRDE